MYYIIKLHYFVAVLSLTYTPILPTFLKIKNVDKIKYKNVTIIKKRKKSFFYIYALALSYFRNYLLLARLMGQYCFARWRLSSSSVTAV